MFEDAELWIFYGHHGDYYVLQAMRSRVYDVLSRRNSVNLKDYTLVRIPVIKGRIYHDDRDDGSMNVMFIYEKWYDKETKQMRNRKAMIGKIELEFPNAMFPNENYEKFFDIETGELKQPLTEPEIPEEETEQEPQTGTKSQQRKKPKAEEKPAGRKETGEKKGTKETADGREPEQPEDSDQKKKEEEEEKQRLQEFLRQLSVTRAERLQQEQERKLQAEENQLRRELYGEEAFSEIEREASRRRLEKLLMRNADQDPADEAEKTMENKDELTAETETLEQIYEENERRMQRIAVLFQILRGIQANISARTRKKPDEIINNYKVQKINRILTEIRDAYRETGYDDLLELLEEPRVKEEDGEIVTEGMTYSDAEVVLEHYIAITKFVRIKSNKKAKIH